MSIGANVEIEQITPPGGRKSWSGVPGGDRGEGPLKWDPVFCRSLRNRTVFSARCAA